MEKKTYLQRLSAQMDKNQIDERIKTQKAIAARRSMEGEISKQETAITAQVEVLNQIKAEIQDLEDQLENARCPMDGDYDAAKLVSIKQKMEKSKLKGKKELTKLEWMEDGLKWLKQEAKDAFDDIELQDPNEVRNFFK
jgi:hypothetical protein